MSSTNPNFPSSYDPVRSAYDDASSTATLERDQLVGKAHAAIDAGAERAARLGDKAKHLADRYTSLAKNASSTVREEAMALNDRTQRYVRTEPLKAVAIAAFAGAVVGGLLALMNRR